MSSPPHVGPDALDWYALGFGGQWQKTHPDFVGNPSSSIVTPHWFLALIFAILPALWLYKWNKRRKLGPGACAACGYDLTGNESGVCPECGAGEGGKA